MFYFDIPMRENKNNIIDHLAKKQERELNVH